MALLWLLVALAGVIILLFAMFWKRETGIFESIVDGFISADDAKDSSPRAWFLLLGLGLIVLGFYMIVRMYT